MVLDYSVNYLAVLVSAIAGFLVGWIWWGPIFGKKWMALNKMTQKDIDKSKEKGMTGFMIIMFISQLIMAFALAVLIVSTNAASLAAALMLAFWIWLGFVATIGVGIVLWNGKPWGLFWINNIGWLVTIAVMAIILVFWR